MSLRRTRTFQLRLSDEEHERVADAEVNDDKAFKQRVAQIMGRDNVTQAQAETKARES